MEIRGCSTGGKAVPSSCNNMNIPDNDDEEEGVNVVCTPSSQEGLMSNDDESLKGAGDDQTKKEEYKRKLEKSQVVDDNKILVEGVVRNVGTKSSGMCEEE